MSDTEADTYVVELEDANTELHSIIAGLRAVVTDAAKRLYPVAVGTQYLDVDPGWATKRDWLAGEVREVQHALVAAVRSLEAASERGPAVSDCVESDSAVTAADAEQVALLLDQLPNSGLKVSQVADGLNLTPGAARRALRALVEDGRAQKTGDATWAYYHPTGEKP